MSSFQYPLILWIWAFWFPIIHHLATHHPDINFYAYEKDTSVQEYLKQHRFHPYFYKDIRLPENVILVENIEEVYSKTSLIIFAIPNQFIERSLEWIFPHIWKETYILNLSKWINNISLRTVSDSVFELFWGLQNYAVLSGGMIASELMEWKKLGADIASLNDSFSESLKVLFESPNLLIHTYNNPKAVELFGALKNIYALYIGYLEWCWYGFSTIGYHFCELTHDIKKIIQNLGWGNGFDIEQFSLGGDILATCFGNSRNRYFGKLIGEGMSIEEGLSILKSENKHAEGYETLKWVKTFITGKEDQYKELLRVIDIFL